MNWQLQSSTTPQNLDELEELLLSNRQISDPKLFFDPVEPKDIKLDQVKIDPHQVKTAAKLIKKAVADKQKVVIFGDYDADGITAASLLWLTLAKLGLKAQPFIPKREEHGYGISKQALQDILAGDKPDLIITVDNGIVAHEAIKFAQDQGIKVIVTDHHQVDKKHPPAEAVVHSTQICGAAVAWFLARELTADYALELLDLVGIATIADQMPLTDFNRSFAVYGLEALRSSTRPGIKALVEVAGIEQNKIDSFSVGFGLAPRINAAGRLTHGLTAMRLLCTSQLGSAKKIARQLDQVNKDRQDVTFSSYKQALDQVQAQQDQSVLIVKSSDFHEGVIGLIAGRLTEKFYKPAIAISIDQDLAKGSARSVKGVNITQLLRQAQDYLIDVGGHELAAGFSLEVKNLKKFTQALSKLCLEQITPDLLKPEQKIECQLPTKIIDFDLVELIDKFAPFGMGNFPPVFQLNELEVVDVFAMGKDKKHLRLVVKTEGGKILKAVGWRKAQFLKKLKPGANLTMAASVELNHWNGKTNLQLKIKDIKPTQA